MLAMDAQAEESCELEPFRAHPPPPDAAVKVLDSLFQGQIQVESGVRRTGDRMGCICLLSPESENSRFLVKIPESIRGTRFVIRISKPPYCETEDLPNLYDLRWSQFQGDFHPAILLDTCPSGDCYCWIPNPGRPFMLTINGRSKSNCSGMSRRELLQIGGPGLLGLSLPTLLQANTLQGETEPFNGGRAKSVIFLFLFGGPSQLETFDMKPGAPTGIRGPFVPIPCKTPDLHISEHLHRLARISNKYAVVRTMTHDFNDHSGAGHYLQTGKRWHIPVGGGFSATPKDWPSMGSVVEYLSQHAPNGLDHDLPAYAVLPNRLGRLQDKGQYRRPGQYGGWLGTGYNPLTTAIDKRDNSDNPYWRDCSDEELDFQIDGLAPDMPLRRIRQRATLREQLENLQRKIEAGNVAEAMDRHRQRALALVASDKTGHALDIRQESDALRDRYGRHLFGQSCLMARRLVEAGTRFVTVHYDCVDGYSWDSHRNSDDVKNHLLPTFDQGCAALLTDLGERGLLDETLVVAIGEMGRTPKANSSWGRGHWSTCFPALLAGGGIRGGIVYGTSDKHAAYPEENPVSPEDLAKTIYWALGVNPDLFLPNREGRPIPIVDGGKPQTQLFA